MALSRTDRGTAHQRGLSYDGAVTRHRASASVSTARGSTSSFTMGRTAAGSLRMTPRFWSQAKKPRTVSM